MAEEVNMDVYESWSFLGGPHNVVALNETPSRDWVRSYEPLARQGVGIEMGNDADGAAASGSRSLANLAPVMDQVKTLYIATRQTIRDANVINGAARMEALAVYSPLEGPVSLEALPLLTEYQGHLRKTTQSVVENSHVGCMTLTLGSRQVAPVISSPVRRLVQFGGDSGMPSLATPDALIDYERRRAPTFDLREVLSFPRLAAFRLERCAHVTNVAALNRHPSLESVMFQDCTSVEGWESLVGPRKIDLLSVLPAPPETYAISLREHGGTVW